MMTQNRSHATLLGRFLTVTQGRKIASIVLMLIIFIEVLATLPKAPELYFAQVVIDMAKTIRAPVVSARQALFDSYQRIHPRIPQSQPLTVIAIDERSIRQVGQWPWPRSVLADLVDKINAHTPVAIGLDFYMPEPDRQSIENLADLLPEEYLQIREQLLALPTNDFQLAMALSNSPSVVAAVGFSVEAYTSSNQLLATPTVILGSDPLPFIMNYPQVLANLTILTQSASGQALLSIPAQASAIRRFPLLSAVNSQLIASMPIEMLRVATGSGALKIQATELGIQSIQVADLNVLTQGNSDVWPYYASIEDTRERYLSAVDVLNGNFDPKMLEHKLVMIGLTGAGLSDMRFTSLGEHVPGVEIQAQVVEGLYENNLLKRTDWLSLLELILVTVLGGALITAAPKFQSFLEKSFRYHPFWLILSMLAFIALIAGSGLLLFIFTGVLFSSVSVLIGTLMVCGVFFVNAILISLRGTQTKLAQLMESGITFARQREQDQLLEMIQDYLYKIAPHQCSIIFLINQDRELEVVAKRGIAANWSLPIALKANDSSGLYQQWLSQALTKGETHQLIGSEISELLPELSANLHNALAAPLHSLIVIPMLATDQSIKGLTVLGNAKTVVGTSLSRCNRNTIRLIDALIRQATVALENQQLVKSQQNMMDAMVKILAGAIDEKSAYTGGHCERVPLLAEMLCEVACESQQGYLSQFSFTSEDEWREFRMAAWMHDCGKITTPENVVDKATKLEMIYNRIHEVRTRFEVLLRDAQITRLEAIYEQGVDRGQADLQLEQRKQQLLEDFAFIAQCNTGGEFQSLDKVARIQKIGQHTWQRNFDDRLGLSHIEFKRYPEGSQVTLPVTEQLLSDRPEHLVERAYSKSQDPSYGFKMEIPEYLGNHGELHNLQVSRGTLTAEERFVINDHIIQTIVILDQIPFPPNLQRVSEIAGAHHETLIGTGYPRKLTQDELSIPARVLAIADIFEALTAADRPYKKAKTLSEAIHILYSFKRDQHIDPLLFDLFLSEEIYIKYAERFLTPDQIDVVDINRYLG
ncbi:MAG: CHASE2 domain-containing protein [Oceanospirillaceae bacterium]